MIWNRDLAFSPRPIVVVEDHAYHLHEMLKMLAVRDEGLFAHLTVACLDRGGPDTERMVLQWLENHPQLQVAAMMGEGRGSSLPRSQRSRWFVLSGDTFADQNRFCKKMAGMVRPGGLLIQDIQLTTLRFIASDRWWESIYLANTIRGMFPQKPPVCRFMSNKSGFGITFGKDLMEVGFDPRDVIDKQKLSQLLPGVLRRFRDTAFPLVLRLPDRKLGERSEWVGPDEQDKKDVNKALDLVLWMDREHLVELGGRCITPGNDSRRVTLKSRCHEALTWQKLLNDRFNDGEGVPVLEVGRRIAPDGALKAEMTNVAARHLHSLRGRLTEGRAIVTAAHAYHIRRDLKVGVVTQRFNETSKEQSTHPG